ncbi:MAG: 30S ribosomal protein S4 [Oscillospiraceae bacterium]|nr:30S ribosomal protein S4 [Oscillospiraceae bacterium]
MSRYTGPVCRLCRREGDKLFLKGERCYTDKCAVGRRAKSMAPGQHGASAKKPKEYGTQLREKQKAKRIYGLHETQFKNIFRRAEKREGMAGVNLLVLLELRLDNIIYKMGMAESRKEARQLVTHRHFTVNGKKANIPSMTLKLNDVIALDESSRSLEKIKDLIANLDNRTTVKWLDVDRTNVSAKIVSVPTRDDIDFPFREHLIVELYSK